MRLALLKWALKLACDSCCCEAMVTSSPPFVFVLGDDGEGDADAAAPPRGEPGGLAAVGSDAALPLKEKAPPVTPSATAAAAPRIVPTRGDSCPTRLKLPIEAKRPRLFCSASSAFRSNSTISTSCES